VHNFAKNGKNTIVERSPAPGEYTGEKGNSMNNSANAKTQTRVMVVTVALILAFAVVMILLTVSQSRKKPSVEDGTGPATSAPAVSGFDTTAAPQPRPSLKEVETTAPADSESAQATTEELAPVIAPQDVLPEFISPVSGMRMQDHSVDVPVFSVTMNDYRTHTGVDIAAPLGTAVRATADGVIGEVWEDPMMGTCLSVEHSGGARSIYKNLDPELPENVKVGASVKIGETVGAVGESALIEIAQSSHLHYELEIGGASVDPADFMLLGETDTAYEG